MFPAGVQFQDQGVQVCREMPGDGEITVLTVCGEGDSRLLCLDIRRRQERAGGEVAEARVQRLEDNFRSLPVAGGEDQGNEDRKDGYSFHDSRFIVR